MAKQNSVNLDITNNSDGFDVSGGTSSRKLTISGADISLTATGNSALTLPATTGTVALVAGSSTQVQFNDGGSVGANSSLTFDKTSGILSTKQLYVSNSSGDEGGEMLLNKPVTNTTIAGTGVTIDVYQNKLRFFEQGGSARGFYIDITSGSTSANTNLVSSGTVPGGSDTYIQFNDGGTTFGGDAGLTYNKTTDSLTIAGDLAVDGGDITTTSTGIFRLAEQNATGVYFGTGAATDIRAGKSDNSGTIRLYGEVSLPYGTLNTGAATANVFNTAATSLNIGGAATSLSIGSATGTATINNANTVVSGDLAVNGGDITTTSATASVFNTTATTLNIGGAATTSTLGYASTAASTTNISSGAVASGSTKTVNVGTGGASGSTTNVNLGSGSGGTVTVNSDCVVSGNLTVNGTTTTVNSTTTTVDDPIITLGGDTAPTSDDNKDRGVEFRWHNGTTAKVGFFGYDDSLGRFVFIPDATNTSEVFSGTLGNIDVGDILISGTSSTGTGGVVRATSPALVTPILGTPQSGTLTSCTGLPISTGVSGLGAGVATFLGTPSSSNLAAAVSDETGTGALVFANTPTLVTPILGTPTSGTLTNCTGYTVANISGLGTGVATFLGTPSSANLAAAVSDETGTGALVFANTPTLVTPILGTPTSGTLSNCTGLPISTGVGGLGTGIATFLGTPSSANLAAAVTDETGSGALVFATSPSLTTPTLGVATATSVNKVAITAPVTGSTLTIADGKTLTASNTLTFTGTDSSSVAFGGGGTVLYNGGALGTPSSGTLSNCTGLPVSTGISGLGTGVATFLATPSSANLAAAVTDETGSGALVFATSPSLTTPTLGVATATSVNKVAITAPATGSTLTIADGKTLTASNTLTFTGTDSSSVAFGTGGTVLYNGGALGTPSSGTLSSCTGLPISTGVSGLGTGVATFLATPSSANLAAAVTDETGSGALVFGTSPSITTSLTTGSTSFSLINATATSVNFAGAATTLSVGAATGTTTINNANTVVAGDLAVNGGDITTSQTTATVFDTNATTVTAFRSATQLTFGATSGLSQVRNDFTVGGDLTITGGDLITSAATSTLMNTTATNLSVGGQATTLTLGATSGTASIRNATTRLGTTGATVETNSGTTNALTLSPYGNVNLVPTSSSGLGGSRPALSVENTDGGTGFVSITGGNLYLGVKTDGLDVESPVQIVFEGTTDANELTLTVASLTGDRTVTLPDATGTVALAGTGSTTDGRIPYYDTTTNTFLGSSVMSFNDSTSVVTLDGTVNIGGTLGTSNSTVSLLNTVATTINFGGAATTLNLGPTGGTGTIDVNRNTIQEATLKFYNEPTSSPAISSGTLTLDLSAAQVFTVSLNASVTTLTISNTPATASRSIGFTLILTADGTARTVAWGAAVLWPGGTGPTLTSTNGKKDVFSFVTTDGGTTWLGFVGGQNY